MIVLIIVLVVIGFFVYEAFYASRVLEESNNRILDKINGLIDGVKTFFTVTLVEKFSSFHSDKSDETDEFDI
jgi:hypothetical protein